MKKNKKESALLALSAAFLLSLIPLHAEEGTAKTLFDKALAEEQNESWYTASQFYMEALQKNPVYADAWFHLARCSYELGEFDLALTRLDEAEKLSKGDNAIQNLRGMTFIAMGRFSDARAIFQGILKRTPNDIDARFGLAELDLFDGKISGAEKQYTEALKRQAENRKALLSLALVSARLGKTDNARRYINQALSLYSDESEVHYLAAVIHCMQGDIKKAEHYCRVAVEVDGNNEKAYELLAKIRYEQGQFGDVIDFCDFIIGRDRSNAIAWYLKGAALAAQKKNEEAIEIWNAGLGINPIDEVMRAALELEVNRMIPLEDARRGEWAQYHIQNAREYTRRYDSMGTTYEYQRALKIQPSNSEARMNFASMLEMNGLHENYLDQLLFIRENREEADNEKSAEKTAMNDTIEAFESLLQDSLAKKWGVQTFYLDKTRWNLGLYYIPSDVNQIHVQNNRIAAEFASEMFSGISASAVSISVQEIKGFGDAYQKARTQGMDYFVILGVDEGSRDITLEYSVYSARTGTKIKENSLYNTGNYRYSSVFRRFRDEVLSLLTVRANIIDRDGKILLADIGRSENIRNGAVFDIVRKNAISTASSGAGVTYRESDVLGTFTVTLAGEEVSEGVLEYKGFYDRINRGDELVLISLPQSEEELGGADGEKALLQLETVFARVESIWRPVGTEESFEIVRRRLFKTVGEESEREEVCRAFAEMYRAAPGLFPAEVHEADYMDRMRKTYPIHPELFDRLFADWATLQKFQKTRGVLQYMAIVIKRLYQLDTGDLMIMPGSLPLSDGDVEQKSVQYLQRTGWPSVIQSEIDGPASIAGRLDTERPNFGCEKYAERTARTIFVGSAPGAEAIQQNAARGLDQKRILLGSAMPGHQLGVYEDVLDVLRDKSRYLNNERTRFYYDTRPNLRREMEERRAHIDQSKAEDCVRAAVAKACGQGTLFSGVHVFTPQQDIDDNISRGPRLVVMRPDFSIAYSRSNEERSKEAAGAYLANRGTQPRIHQNRLVFLFPDQNNVNRLMESARTFLAWKDIVESVERGNLILDVAQLENARTSVRRAENAVEQSARETYRFALIPQSTDGRTVDYIVERIHTQSGSIASSVEEYLKESDLLVKTWSVVFLKKILETYYFKGETAAVPVRKVWEDTCSYLYLPRLLNEDVFVRALVDGVQDKSFGFASGKDADAYSGFAYGESILFPQIDGEMVVISKAEAERLHAKREVAEKCRVGRGGIEYEKVDGQNGNNDSPYQEI